MQCCILEYTKTESFAMEASHRFHNSMVLQSIDQPANRTHKTQIVKAHFAVDQKQI